MIHAEPHQLAGTKVTLTVQGDQELEGQQMVVEDWWDRVGQGSWMNEDGNPACLKFAMRSGLAGLLLDDEVVYGKVGPLGHLVHVSELGEVSA